MLVKSSGKECFEFIAPLFIEMVAFGTQDGLLYSGYAITPELINTDVCWHREYSGAY